MQEISRKNTLENKCRFNPIPGCDPTSPNDDALSVIVYSLIQNAIETVETLVEYPAQICFNTDPLGYGLFW